MGQHLRAVVGDKCMRGCGGTIGYDGTGLICLGCAPEPERLAAINLMVREFVRLKFDAGETIEIKELR